MARRERHGPEFKPVDAVAKQKEWAAAIQTSIRYRNGHRLNDEKAASIADLFWKSLVGRNTPLKEIMDVPGGYAVEWTLASFDNLVLATAANIKKHGKKKEEP
jgi:hypothetical protein